ncbi:helix-turn-helix domain-containing protein [Clostridium tyrobutyricum]|uniref:helix-turn-helix transcriptional regulator n=1 Tax=Clostridium tyrobutyricum TaxID=1519 RepID=UPI001C383378|nr:helix-turn-helix domain-containing protein [Clostridium tyrobutyricum]MBV4420172.1 helix-turn-helix domain-containing protein [Clostridium tyrobutyricum]
MFKDKLKKIRKDNNLTQSQFGKVIGVTGAYIQQLEKGIKKNPSLEIVFKICNKFNIDPVDLIDSNSELLNEFINGLDENEKDEVTDSLFNNEFNKIANVLEDNGYEINRISSDGYDIVEILKDDCTISEMLEVDFVNNGIIMVDSINKFIRFSIEDFLETYNNLGKSKNK